MPIRQFDRPHFPQDGFEQQEIAFGPSENQRPFAQSESKSTQSQPGTIVSVVREQHSHHCSSQPHRPEDRSPPLPTPLNTNVAQADWDSVLGNPRRPKRNQFDKSNPRSQFQSSKPKLPDRRSPEVDVQAKNTVWPNTPSVFAVKPSLRILRVGKLDSTPGLQKSDVWEKEFFSDISHRSRTCCDAF